MAQESGVNRGIHDSGKRQQFETGAVRDTADDKPRPDLISPFFSERLGEWLRKGAQKYSARNWEKGIPNSRCLASLERHLVKFKQGKVDEDHEAAIAFNIMAIIHNQRMIAEGLMDPALDDLPKYLAPRETMEPEAKTEPMVVCDHSDMYGACVGCRHGVAHAPRVRGAMALRCSCQDCGATAETVRCIPVKED